MTNKFRETVVFVAEFTADNPDQRAGSGLGRLLSVSVTEAGDYRVTISAPSPVSANLPFVELSNEVHNAATYDFIRSLFPTLKNLVVRVGSL
jgi:hypothetical protein